MRSDVSLLVQRLVLTKLTWKSAKRPVIRKAKAYHRKQFSYRYLLKALFTVVFFRRRFWRKNTTPTVASCFPPVALISPLLRRTDGANLQFKPFGIANTLCPIFLTLYTSRLSFTKEEMGVRKFCAISEHSRHIQSKLRFTKKEAEIRKSCSFSSAEASLLVFSWNKAFWEHRGTTSFFCHSTIHRRFRNLFVKKKLRRYFLMFSDRKHFSEPEE